MASSSRQTLSLLAALAIAFGADPRAFSAAVPVVVAPEASPGPGPAGFIILHFTPSQSGEPARVCQRDAKKAAKARTLFRPYRRADGALLAITGHVALRFKTSTSERQIDSLIAATGTEVFPSATRPGCRRYVIRVVQPEDDPATVANKLQQTGLVDYATPDLSAGRPEGVPGDSFFVDQGELSKSMSKTASEVAALPSTYGMGQLLSEYTGPVMRISGADLSAAMASPSAAMSPIDLVKSHGITTLHLAIPDRTTAAPVRVMLYTLTGTPVRQLVSETLEPGQYIVGWDGKDDRGRRVQPGVYVAVMTAENFHETRRLVVR